MVSVEKFAGTVLSSTMFPVATSLVIIWYATADGTEFQVRVTHVGPALVIAKYDGGGRLHNCSPAGAEAEFEGSTAGGTAGSALLRSRKKNNRVLLNCLIMC